MARSRRGSGQQGQCTDVSRAYDGEVPAIQVGDLGEPQSLRDGDDACVGGAERRSRYLRTTSATTGPGGIR
jgi:hypothetical protein